LAPIEPSISAKANDRARILDLKGISKAFAGKSALTNVSLRLDEGQVVGLVGENGAGKSTLLKIVSGNLRADSGSIAIRGREVELRSYQDANRAGIFHIYQDLALVPTMSVYENVLLSHEARFSRFGAIDNRAMRDRVAGWFEEFGHGRIDVSRKIQDFDFSTRQVIEIIKAFALAELLGIEMPVMLLDEPTAALTGDEVEFLMGLIARTRQRASIVYVSHRLSEVLKLSDILYVLKDGSVVASMPVSDVTESELHERMVGRTRQEFFYREQAQRDPDPAVVLEVRDLAQSGCFGPISFSLKAGEILGVAGLLGSGKSDVARALAGDVAHITGRIVVSGSEVQAPSIATMSGAGIGYLPPDRREGVIPVLSVAVNMTLARLTRGDSGILLDPKAELKDVEAFISMLGIKTPSAAAPASELSGGNQQKVLLARWLMRNPKVLVLDNPTNGVDAGAKEEIYGVLRSIAAQGIGILLVSDDLPEIIGLSNRILVMRGGEITREIDAPPEAKPREVDVVTHMV
jgi:ribose transport system ATP-binding protein